MRGGAIMKIGVIGSGHVGGTLGSRWAKMGHEVVFGSRHPEAPHIVDLLAESGPTATAATLAETLATCDVLLLATPWGATQQTLESLGDFGNKILIDATNPLLPDLSGLTHGNTTSGGELVASWATNAVVVKAFNSVGFPLMANPHFAEQSSVLFYCGDDKEAKAVVHDLAEELGFEPEDAGPLTQARVLEPFALLWISLAVKQQLGPGIGFKFLRR